MRNARRGHRWALLWIGLPALWLAFPLAGQPAQADVAGEVAARRVWAYGTPPDDLRRDLFLQDEVYVREVLETPDKGALHVRLRDNTMLRLGSASRVVVDEFVYQPDADSAALIASVTKGVCRFISGNAATRKLEVRTPAATIAARGTEFSIWILEDGSTTIWVQEGAVEVTPADGSPTATVNAAEIVRAPIAGGGIELDAQQPLWDPGLADTPRVLMRRKNK